MKSIQDVQVEKPAGSTGGSAGGAPKEWTITGRLLVRETEIDGASHDRPLKGVEVKVSASDIGGDGPWTEWGTVRTDADGDFSVSETNNGRDRFFRVQTRLKSADLEVEDATLDDIKQLDVTDRNWRTVWKSNGQLSGPAVSVGTRVFASGQPLDLGDAANRRRALIWYVLRTVIDRLEDEDPWFATADKVVVVYPARSVIATSYVGYADAKIYLAQGPPDDEWHPLSALAWFMLLWNQYHREGASTRFTEGFSGFASEALMHELWGRRLKRPLNRRAVAAGLELSTLDEIDSDASGTSNVLRLLRYGDRQGWWSHLFGSAQQYPDNRPDDDGDGEPDHPDEVGVKYRLDGRVMPAGPHHLSLWEILRTFKPRSDLDEWDGGVVGFVDRAVDVHDLGEEVRTMLKRSIDPLALTEPFESLPKR
jgi:hypothetical protein